MAEHDKHGRFAWKCQFISLFLIIGFLSVAECNYEALYDYERASHVDTFDTYIVEDGRKSITLDQPIYFYGQKYSTLQVSKDGTVSFGDDPVTFKRNPQWPRGFTELTSSLDKPFIAPFHYDGYASDTPQTYQGRLYWSKYERQRAEDVTEDTKKHQVFLDNLGKYLSHASVTVTTFTPRVYVMVTWENVTDHGTKTDQNLSCRAEFTNPCPAGMNGGRGRGWRDVVKCVGTCRKNKQYRRIPHLLPSLQGSSSSDRQAHDLSGGRASSSAEVLGRFIYLVTDDIIVRGGCLPRDTKVAGYMDTVEVFPHHVQMLGGDIIKVSGQCQQPYSTVYCRFNSQEMTEGKVSAGMVGWCPVPRLLQRGHVKLEVSPNTNQWHVYTHVIALPPDHLGRLSDDPTLQPWFKVNPTQLTLTWNSSRLTRDVKATVDIVLVQYQETANEVRWKDLVKLAEKVPNNGNFRFDPNSDDAKYRCREYCDDIELGVVEVRLTEDYLEAATENQYLAIGPLPLAWYVNHVQSEERGTQWYQDHCQHWAHRGRSDLSWQAELPPCPCSLQQAVADWGRWQADVGCSLFNKGSKCAFNRGAKHCVRSVHPTARGGGSHCCFDNDNNLMYAADSYQGSMSSKAHAWGAPPYGQPGTVPSLSHWLHDLIPYYYCCQWSSEDYCYLYTERRPTTDCRFYDPPGAATIYGDPHVQTFDEERYHFGGAGDFWLVRSPSLSLQARFLEVQKSAVLPVEHALLPTYMSSVAVRGAARSDTVTFTLAPPDDLHHGRLDVKVNGRHYFFDTPLYMWQDFVGLSVVNNEKYATSADDRYHSNFTVLLEGGAGVQVAERLGLLHVVVLLPPLKKHGGQSVREPASKGLLGSWDERKTNEYMTPDGNYVPAWENDFNKYKDFALKWAVQGSQKSLFRFNHLLSDRFPYTDPISNRLNPAQGPSEGEVSATCGTKDDNNPCVYDYLVTGNRTLALHTRTASEAFESLRRSQKKIWSCGWPDIPLAIKDHVNYSAGRSVRVVGCRQGWNSAGRVQGGPTHYTCVQNETDRQPFWDPYDDFNHFLCTDDVEDASLAMIIGIVVAVVAVIVIIVVIVIVVYRRKRSGKQSVNKRKATRQDQDMEPGTDETLVKGRKEGSYPMSERQTRQNSDV
ncbi:hypothetical protein ACOMHN_014161 [Nucella lapillus]